MTTTDTIYQILSGHHEMTSGQILKNCLSLKIPGITNAKSVSNALTRLKKDGSAESIYDEDKGIWLWRAVRDPRDPGEIAPGRDASEVDFPDPFKDVTTPNVVNHDAECRDKPRKPSRPYTPNKIAGAYSYRGALVIKLDRKANAKSVTLSQNDMAMLVAIHGNMA